MKSTCRNCDEEYDIIANDGWDGFCSDECEEAFVVENEDAGLSEAEIAEDRAAWAADLQNDIEKEGGI